VERDENEGPYVVLVIEVIIDVEELVPRSMEENFCLLRFCRHGEVDLRPKARGREKHVPPRPTDVSYSD